MRVLVGFLISKVKLYLRCNGRRIRRNLFFFPKKNADGQDEYEFNTRVIYGMGRDKRRKTKKDFISPYAIPPSPIPILEH